MNVRTIFCRLSIVSLCGLLTALAATASADTGPTLIQTDKGAVQGTLGANGVRVFQGIPFAAPPVGPNRFAPPQPPAAWTTTLTATSPAPPCPQMASMTQNTTEDCLYLNVWAPADVSVKRPVLVFLYGGGFTQGNAAAYEGRMLAERDGIVVVTPNYRNGLFGFMASPALDPAGKGDTGNYALEDQQAALRWVHANIAQFGGDPNNVTLGGESAGAMSTCMQIASPAAAGLFVRAIVESGPCAATWPTLQQQEATLAPLAAQLGCTGSNTDIAACLRSGAVTIQRLLAAQATLPRGTISPSIGGSDVPAQPRTAIGRVPLLIGGNNLEAGYILLLKPPADIASYEAALTLAYAGNAAAVEAHYPFAKYPSGGIAISSVQTDWAPSPYITWCEDVRTFELMKAAGTAPLYAYEFNDPNSYGFTGAPGPVHTAELPYLFANWGNVYPATGRGVAATSASLSDAMLRYWGNFVKTGNPNGPNLPAWPAYRTYASVLQLAPKAIRPGIDVNAEHQCAFWNALGFAR